MQPGELENLNEVLVYWQDTIKGLSDRNDQEVAYDMVRVVSSAHFDDWYNGPHSNGLFAETFDYLTDLEVPDGPKDYRKAKWALIKALLRMLEDSLEMSHPS